MVAGEKAYSALLSFLALAFSSSVAHADDHHGRGHVGGGSHDSGKGHNGVKAILKSRLLINLGSWQKNSNIDQVVIKYLITLRVSQYFVSFLSNFQQAQISEFNKVHIFCKKDTILEKESINFWHLHINVKTKWKISLNYCGQKT